MPILLILILLFCIWLHFELKASSRKSETDVSDFIAKEKASNLTRKKDISSLDYISIPLKQLPIQKTSDSQINACIDAVTELSSKKILNLSGYTNTELKEKYGIVNLEELSNCDENFYSLIQLLNEWGMLLINAAKPEDAKTVLEYAVSINSDTSKTYLQLARIYESLGQTALIDNLIKLGQANIEQLPANFQKQMEQIKYREYFE